MNAEQDRELLVLAAAEGTLDDAQRAALDRLREQDRSVDDEIASLRDVLATIGEAGHGWDESAMNLSPSSGVLEGALDRITEEQDPAQGQWTEQDLVPVRDLDRRRARRADAAGQDQARPGRRGLLLGMAAAGLVATGAVGSEVIRGTRPDTPPASSGAPGELGAFESLSVTGTPPGARVDLGLIAHTWGTESVLVVEGSQPGAAYDVVLVGRDGTAVPTGSFLGTEAPLDCEMNAAILRADVAELRIVAPDGTVWSRAQVPTVSA